MDYLESDLLVQGNGPVAESDGIAETPLPLDYLLGKVHDNLGTLRIRVKEKWAGWKGTTNATALDRQTSLVFVMTAVGCGWERATEGVWRKRHVTEINVHKKKKIFATFPMDTS